MAAPASLKTPSRSATGARAITGVAALALWLGWVIPLLYRTAPSADPALGLPPAVCSPIDTRR
ncbi:hypothetical protein [Stenotrophomonas sp. PS02289]|uniref:hypothetical protein n=1 Tax=Stenotrophomonas sp. PS02289 TaxID=2991422 RepID=UPI00249B2A2D|nr:hypothetical protein [Stenotrophomonas sp. PS02289]